MIIVGRVVVVLLIWLALFLAMFLGYFTVPILLVGVMTLVYGLSDIGLFVAMRRQQQARDARRDFVRLHSAAEDSVQAPAPQDDLDSQEMHASSESRNPVKVRDSKKSR
jgi:predicted DNA repair protein MutK